MVPDELQFLECDTCGAVVIQEARHSYWHSLHTGERDVSYIQLDLVRTTVASVEIVREP